MTAIDRQRVIEDAARALALTEDYDGCFERLAAWRDASPEDQILGLAEEPLSTDGEDAQWWRARAQSALPVIAAVVLKPIREQHGVPHWCMDDEGRSDCYHPDGPGMPWPCPTARLCDEIEATAKGGE